VQIVLSLLVLLPPLALIELVLDGQVTTNREGSPAEVLPRGAGDCTVNGVTPIKEEHDEQAG
jgi:hypothetical protein